MRDWYANDSFWEAFFPYMFPDDRFDAADSQVESIIKLTRVHGGGAVLDLCCGPGRHAVAFALKGFRVTGVDLSSFLLAKARERGRGASVDVEWIEDDMRTFSRPGAYDLLVNLFTAFGYFDDPEDDMTVLCHMHANLAPGGACVIDVVSKEWLAKVFTPASVDEYEDGTLMIQRREIVDDWTRIRNQWILLRDGRSRSFTLEHTIYSGRELKDRMLQAGFDEVNLYGDYEGNAYGRDTKRLVAVGRKRV